MPNDTVDDELPPKKLTDESVSSPRPRDAPAKDFSELDRILKRFSLIYGTKTVFDKDKHVIIELGAMQAAFPAWFKYWKEHPERVMVDPDRIVFEPERKLRPGYLNLWRGIDMQPKKGDCQALLDLLCHLCGADMEVYQWVLRWLAYPLRNPGAKMQSALIFHGDEGSGKNLFFESIKEIYGTYGVIIGQDQLESQYNGWISGKCFAIADEVLSRVEMRQHKGRLNSYVTGTQLIVNEKHLAGRVERNCMNIVFLSNELIPIPLTDSDRRHLVIYTPPKAEQAFYKTVGACIDAGGVEALYHYLLHELDLGDFTVHTKPLLNEAKKRLVAMSLTSVQMFYKEWSEGTLPVKFVSCRTRDLYKAYRSWCDKTGDRFPYPMQRFSGEINRKVSSKIARIGDSKQQNTCFIVNPELRRLDQTEQAWLGDAVAIFVEGLDTFSKGWDEGFSSHGVDE